MAFHLYWTHRFGFTDKQKSEENTTPPPRKKKQKLLKPTTHGFSKTIYNKLWLWKLRFLRGKNQWWKQKCSGCSSHVRHTMQKLSGQHQSPYSRLITERGSWRVFLGPFMNQISGMSFSAIISESLFRYQREKVCISTNSFLCRVKKKHKEGMDSFGFN